MPGTLESSVRHSWLRITDRFYLIAQKMHGSIYSYVFAFVLMLLALFARLGIAPINAGLQYLTFFPAVAIAAVVGGFWPGLFATTIGLFFATTILTPPFYSLSIEVLRTSFWPNMVFLADGIIVSTAIEIMHSYRQKFTGAASKYQHLMKTSIDGIHIMDIDGNLLEANDAFCRMLGYTQEEVVHLNVADWDAKWTTKELQKAFKELIGKSMTLETSHRRKDGTLLEVEISASNTKLGDNYLFFAASRDISDRKRMEEELVQTATQLRELAANYEASQEAERKAIAREVHDELGQLLSTLRLNISMVRSRFGNLHSELMALAQNMTDLVDRAIHGVRNVSENLRPAVLGIGLFPSIKWLCDNFAEQSGINCALDSPDPGVVMDEERAVVLFRIVQESLTNVLRHSHARRVKVTVKVCDENLCVEVKDDGKGFDLKHKKRKGSFGLFGMEERALNFGGSLNIVSSPGNGTSVNVTIPIVAGKPK